MTKQFWELVDELVATSKIVIDRPAGSRHPRWEDITYPLDYGYLSGTMSGDGQDIDVWCGSAPEQRVTAVILTIDVMKRDAEMKFLIGCTPHEIQDALSTHQQQTQGAILVHREDGWGSRMSPRHHGLFKGTALARTRGSSDTDRHF